MYDSHLSLYCNSYSGSGGTTSMGCVDIDNSAGYFMDVDGAGFNNPYAVFDNLSSYVDSSTQINKLGLTLATGFGTAYPNCVFQTYRNATNITNSYFDDSTNYDIAKLAVFGLYEVQGNIFQPYFIGSMGAYSFGKYMTSTQVSTYYNILQTFQTILGRNV